MILKTSLLVITSLVLSNAGVLFFITLLQGELGGGDWIIGTEITPNPNSQIARCNSTIKAWWPYGGPLTQVPTLVIYIGSC